MAIKDIKSMDDLSFDTLNFNKHTDEGMRLLEKSVSENKFGRSVLADKEGNLIAGNGVVETAQRLGKRKIKVVQTNGDELVVVQRTDLDIDSKEARELALADNAVARKNLEWDEDNIRTAVEKFQISPEEWGASDWEDEEVEEGGELTESELNELIERASKGCIEQYNDDTNYDLGNLYRRRVSEQVSDLFIRGVQDGTICKELEDVFKCRLAQLTYFNFDELIKYYRSADSTPVERELLKRLYLVFITPKEAVESGMLRMEAETGRIYEQEFDKWAEGEK